MSSYSNGDRCVGSILKNRLIRVEDVEREIGFLDTVEWFKQYIGSIKFSELLKLKYSGLVYSCHNANVRHLTEIYSAFVRTYVDEDGKYISDDENDFVCKYKKGKLVKKIVNNFDNVDHRSSITCTYKKGKLKRYKISCLSSQCPHPNVYVMKYGKTENSVWNLKPIATQHYSVIVTVYSASTKLKLREESYVFRTGNIKNIKIKDMGEPHTVITWERDKFGNIMNEKKVTRDGEEVNAVIIDDVYMTPQVNNIGYIYKYLTTGETESGVIKVNKTFRLRIEEALNIVLECEE